MPTLTVSDIAEEVLDLTVNTHEYQYRTAVSKRNGLVQKGYAPTRIRNGLRTTAVSLIRSVEGTRYVPRGSSERPGVVTGVISGLYDL